MRFTTAPWAPERSGGQGDGCPLPPLPTSGMVVQHKTPEQVVVARQEVIPKESTGLFRLRGLLFLEHCGPHSVWKGP